MTAVLFSKHQRNQEKLTKMKDYLEGEDAIPLRMHSAPAEDSRGNYHGAPSGQTTRYTGSANEEGLV
jgi:hypothetical protein